MNNVTIINKITGVKKVVSKTIASDFIGTGEWKMSDEKDNKKVSKEIEEIKPLPKLED